MQSLKLTSRLPAILSFALVAIQMAVPWTAHHFVTQDGPSHVYAATIARELLLHPRTSNYAALYEIHATVPNWTSTVVLAIAASVAGPEHAQQLLVSVSILLGFFGFCYLARALAPEYSPWFPVFNFLLQTWFLWMGFYNFYLGMALLPYPIGFYIARAGRLTWRRALAVAIGLLILFVTHIVAAAIAILAISVIAFWINVIAPIALAARPRERWLPSAPCLRELAMLLAAIVPVIILASLFVRGASTTAEPYQPQALTALKNFPMEVFVAGTSRFGRQIFLWPIVLCYIVAGLFCMTKQEWFSPRGGMSVAALLMFAIYLLVPNFGFGGSAVKDRFSLAFFVLGLVAASSVVRLRTAKLPLALYAAALVFAGSLSAARTARSMSAAADEYLSVANQLPSGSTLIRLRYPTPDAAARYGYQGARRNPLYHLDALAATVCRCIDLSDYEAISKVFPVVYRQKIAIDQQYGLWSLERPGPDALRTVTGLRQSLPVPIDFVLLVGDDHSPDALHSGMPEMMEYLGSNMYLLAVSPNRLVRLYRRNDFSAPPR
jgi:hypothetical protein